MSLHFNTRLVQFSSSFTHSLHNSTYSTMKGEEQCICIGDFWTVGISDTQPQLSL